MQFFAGTRCRVTPSAAKIVLTQAIVLPGALASVWATGGVFTIETQITAAVPIWLTIGGFVLGFVFQILALARISATVAGLVFCLEPVVAAMTSAIVLGERLQAIQYFGGFLVIVAIALTMVAERQAAR
jgi:drug/metabolite transporter (DMT)-like permease